MKPVSARTAVLVRDSGWSEEPPAPAKLEVSLLRGQTQNPHHHHVRPPSWRRGRATSHYSEKSWDKVCPRTGGAESVPQWSTKQPAHGDHGNCTATWRTVVAMGKQNKAESALRFEEETEQRACVGAGLGGTL